MNVSAESNNYDISVSGNYELERAEGGAVPSFLALPVVINYFKAQIVNGYLVVSWGTTSESNNEHFEIEVSSDAKNFKTIGRKEPLGKNGASLQALDYEHKIELQQIVLSSLSVVA
jgi:hypothetical protein